MGANNTIIVRDRVYIPINAIDHERVMEKYTHRLYDEGTCRRCDNRSDRHNHICQACPHGAYHGRIRTAAYHSTEKGVQYLGLPIGDKANIEKKTRIQFKYFKIKDKRTVYPFRVKWKFLADLYEYQVPLVEDWLKSGYGVIKAPPRTGKTIAMLATIHKLGQRAIIIADQYEFLDQFVEHIEDYTNLPKLEEKYGRKLYGYPKNLEDFDKYEICLCTYQQFMEANSNGKRRLKRASKNYGTLFIDEVHRANANQFSKVISSFAAKYKGAVTATPKRKDGRHFVIEELVGPVVAKTSIQALIPKITVHTTDIKPRYPYKLWHYAINFLATNKKRNEMIVDYVMRDLKKGRSIVIPLVFKKHIFNLVDMINRAAGETVAVSYVGGGGKKNKEERNKIRELARSGDIKVVVGIRRLLQVGINIPAWSCLYMVMPMSNQPNFEQESSRIRTPMDGKPQPLIRMFVDPNLGQSLGCFISTCRHAFDLKYEFTDKAMETFKELAKRKRFKQADGMFDYNPDLDSSPVVDAIPKKQANVKKPIKRL